MEDLEFQLGHSRVSYMQIRVSYSHSAFPDDCRSEVITGVSGIRSRMETLATATLKRHSAVSPWSPRPTPAPNHLFQLIERHWGASKAREAMQQILAQRSTPRKAAQAGLAAYKEDSEKSMYASANTSQTSARFDRPTVPIRQASLQRPAESQLDPWRQPSLLNEFSSHNRLPASKGSERQGSLSLFDASSSSRGGAQRSNGSPSSRSRNSGHDIRTMTSEGVKSLMPRLADFTFEARDRNSRGAAGTARGNRGKKEMSTRWGWTSWFSN